MAEPSLSSRSYKRLFSTLSPLSPSPKGEGGDFLKRGALAPLKHPLKLVFPPKEGGGYSQELGQLNSAVVTGMESQREANTE